MGNSPTSHSVIHISPAKERLELDTTLARYMFSGLFAWIVRTDIGNMSSSETMFVVLKASTIYPKRGRMGE